MSTGLLHATQILVETQQSVKSQRIIKVLSASACLDTKVKYKDLLFTEIQLQCFTAERVFKLYIIQIEFTKVKVKFR